MTNSKRPIGWDWDLYADRIVICHKGQWRWAAIAAGWYAQAARYAPNDHNRLVHCTALRLETRYAAGVRRIPDALVEGLISLDRPLAEDEERSVNHVRFGRVAYLRGTLLHDSIDPDFGDADDLEWSCQGPDAS